MNIKTLKHTDGREISLDMDANTIPKLKNQLMVLGMNGLAYSDIWNDVAKKLKKLEELNKEPDEDEKAWKYEDKKLEELGK